MRANHSHIVCMCMLTGSVFSSFPSPFLSLSFSAFLPPIMKRITAETCTIYRMSANRSTARTCSRNFSVCRGARQCVFKRPKKQLLQLSVCRVMRRGWNPVLPEIVPIPRRGSKVYIETVTDNFSVAKLYGTCSRCPCMSLETLITQS